MENLKNLKRRKTHNTRKHVSNHTKTRLFSCILKLLLKFSNKRTKHKKPGLNKSQQMFRKKVDTLVLNRAHYFLDNNSITQAACTHSTG